MPSGDGGETIGGVESECKGKGGREGPDGISEGGKRGTETIYCCGEK